MQLFNSSLEPVYHLEGVRLLVLYCSTMGMSDIVQLSSHSPLVRDKALAQDATPAKWSLHTGRVISRSHMTPNQKLGDLKSWHSRHP